MKKIILILSFLLLTLSNGYSKEGYFVSNTVGMAIPGQGMGQYLPGFSYSMKAGYYTHFNFGTFLSTNINSFTGKKQGQRLKVFSYLINLQVRFGNKTLTPYFTVFVGVSPLRETQIIPAYSPGQTPFRSQQNKVVKQTGLNLGFDYYPDERIALNLETDYTYMEYNNSSSFYTCRIGAKVFF